MDRVQLGRALGYGARHAAKAAGLAVKAAASPRPGASAAAPPARPAQTSARASNRHPGNNKKRSMWSPFVQFSSVLWLQVTGTFFAVFAVLLGEAAWRLHGAALGVQGTAEAEKFYLYAGLWALFVYFAVSSFARARRRERG